MYTQFQKKKTVDVARFVFWPRREVQYKKNMPNFDGQQYTNAFNLNSKYLQKKKKMPKF